MTTELEEWSRNDFIAKELNREIFCCFEKSIRQADISRDRHKALIERLDQHILSLFFGAMYTEFPSFGQGELGASCEIRRGAGRSFAGRRGRSEKYSEANLPRREKHL